jgi:hypothetical protein
MTGQQYNQVFKEYMVDKGHQLVDLSDKKNFLYR